MKMNKEEADLIIAEQNRSTEEILKAVAKVKSDFQELCNLKDKQIAELEKQVLDLQSDREIFLRKGGCEAIRLEKDSEELKAQLWGAKSTCNNCGNADCENYQRQRRSAPCELWISHRDKIIMSKEIIMNLLCLLEDYKKQIVFNEDLQKIKKAEDFLNN